MRTAPPSIFREELKILGASTLNAGQEGLYNSEAEADADIEARRQLLCRGDTIIGERLEESPCSPRFPSSSWTRNRAGQSHQRRPRHQNYRLTLKPPTNTTRQPGSTFKVIYCICPGSGHLRCHPGKRLLRCLSPWAPRPLKLV